MQIIRKNKYSIISKIAKYALVFVIALSVVSPVFAKEKCNGFDSSGKQVYKNPSTGVVTTDCDPVSGANNTNNNQSGANNTNNNQSGANNTNTNTNQSGANNGINLNTGIKNPLGPNLQTIPQFIEAIINFILYLAVPVVALAIIYSGFLFVTAQGNSEKLKSAKKAILYTLIGASLLLGAFVISKAIQGTVEEIKKTS
jgi:hypothetical protein